MNLYFSLTLLPMFYLGSCQLSINSLSLNAGREILFNMLEPANQAVSSDPDEELPTPEIIKRHGYHAEVHTVQTEDGYLLTVHRIPCGIKCNMNQIDNNQPVLLQHGLLGSSADWVIPGPEKALAYVLADANYDVWLGNARGNSYSRQHVNMSSADSAFWQFTWHEMGHYDIPAVIDYIRSIKTENKNILYVAHSMGTTMSLVMLSTRPDYNNKIKAAFMLAPVAYMSHIKSPIRLLAPFSRNVQWIIRLFGADEFLPQSKLIQWLAKYGCEITQTERFVCENYLFVICGFDAAQFNTTLIPVILGHTPAGTSTRTILHYAQEISAGGAFMRYDFGAAENQRIYGTVNPPAYNLSLITTPIALYYSDNDWLAGPKDVDKLFRNLPNAIGAFRVPLKKFNHVDFIWGKDAPQLLYATLKKQMKLFP